MSGGRYSKRGTDTPVAPKPETAARDLSGMSGFYVPPDPVKLAEIAGRHIRWINDSEDWKRRKSQQVYDNESRLKSLEGAQHAHEIQRRDDRLWLEREFASLRQDLELVKRDVRHTITIAIVVWVVLTTLVGLVLKFV
jgi:hypothetical protein